MAQRRGFRDAREQDEKILENLIEATPRRFKLFVLGDVGHWNNSIRALVDAVKGKGTANQIVLLPGNHDKYKAERYLELGFDDVISGRKYGNYWISHFPVHPQELVFRKGNIHGHLHATGSTGPLPFPYFNVSLDMANYMPINFTYIESWWSAHTKEFEDE